MTRAIPDSLAKAKILLHAGMAVMWEDMDDERCTGRLEYDDYADAYYVWANGYGERCSNERERQKQFMGPSNIIAIYHEGRWQWTRQPRRTRPYTGEKVIWPGAVEVEIAD